MAPEEQLGKVATDEAKPVVLRSEDVNLATLVHVPVMGGVDKMRGRTTSRSAIRGQIFGWKRNPSVPGVRLIMRGRHTVFVNAAHSIEEYRIWLHNRTAISPWQGNSTSGPGRSINYGAFFTILKRSESCLTVTASSTPKLGHQPQFGITNRYPS